MSSGIIRPTQSGLRPNRDWRRFCVARGGGGGGGLGTSVDMLVRFEDGADEANVTPTILNNATIKTAAAAGTWTVPILAPKIETAQEIAINGLHVGGVGSIDAGSTRSMKTNVATDQTFARYVLTTPAQTASFGMAWRTAMTGSFFNFYTIAAAHATGGDYSAFHMRDFSPMQCCIESASGTDDPNLVTLASNTWYWITWLYQGTGDQVVRLRVYNPSTWAQIGNESTQTVPTDAFQTLEFGRQDNHDVFGTEDTFIDDLAMCLSTGVGATFPLLPT